MGLMTTEEIEDVDDQTPPEYKQEIAAKANRQKIQINGIEGDGSEAPKEETAAPAAAAAEQPSAEQNEKPLGESKEMPLFMQG